MSAGKRFEFASGGSSKFWEITLDGSAFTVTFGRIGSAGQTQTKTFASEAVAQKEHDKLVREKVAKGYTETGAAQAVSSDAPPSPRISATSSAATSPSTVASTSTPLASARPAPTPIAASSQPAPLESPASESSEAAEPRPVAASGLQLCRPTVREDETPRVWWTPAA